MRKKLLCFLCCMAMLVTGVSAQADKPAIDSETRIVSLSGNSELGGESVSVVITKPETDANITIDNIKTKTTFVYEFDTAENGDWSGQFTLSSDAACGKYMVYINGELPQYFYYADENEIAQALGAVKGATAQTIGGVLNQYTADKEVLAVNLAGDYARFLEKEKQATFVHTAILKYVDEYDNLKINDVTVSFNKALEAANYAFGDVAAVKRAIGSNLFGIDIDSEVDIDALADMYITQRSETNDATAIEKDFRIATALIKINSATKGEMTDILEEYNDALELDLDGDYDDLDKVEVNKGLVKKSFKNIDELIDAFEDSVDAVEKKNKSTSSGRGGSSGSGGGGKVTSHFDVYNESAEDEVVSTPDKKPAKVKFTDIGNVAWASEYINELSEKGIINGVGGDRFAPMDNVTREAYLKMLLCAFNVELPEASSSFADVDVNAWYAPYVSWAVENGIVNGVSADKFGIGQFVSREQMAVMSVRMLEKFGVDLPDGSLDFVDNNLINKYAKSAVAKIQAAGVVAGMPDGTFAPQANLTRAQAAKIICLVMKVGGADE